MDRLKKHAKGFTLVELIIAVVLSFFVLLAAANLMVSFGRFASNPESSLLGTALGPFEEIVSYISQANKVSIRATTGPDPNMDVPNIVYPGTSTANNSCIQIRVDTANTPAVYTDDTVYNYWQNSAIPAQLLKSVCTGAGCSANEVIARNLHFLSFIRAKPIMNQINVILEARVASGPKGDISRERLETAAIMRGRDADTP